MKKVQFLQLHKEAVAPRRGTPGSAGIDVPTDKPFGIAPNQRLLVSTGLAMKLPPGTYGKLEPRSGLAAKFGIDPIAWFLDDTASYPKPILAGVIDCDYRGEIKIVLLNTGDKYAMFGAGEFVAQLVVREYVDLEIELVDEKFENTERLGGFSSTGR